MFLRRMKPHFVLPLAASMLMASAGFAQTTNTAVPDPMGGLQPPKLGGETNAALLYFQAFERLSREDGNLIQDKYTERKSGWVPDEATTKLLVANQRYIEDLMFAANTPACDFGVRYDQGFEALLPHLGLMRRGVRVLLADTYRLVHEGKEGEAAKRVAAVFHIADHMRNDRVLISSLVGIAITAAGTNCCEELLKDGKMSNEIARAAVTALRAQHDDDFMGFRGAIEGESRLAVDWARTRFKGPTAGAEFARILSGEQNNLAADVTNPITKMDEAQLGAELDRMAAYYVEVRKAMDEPDTQKRFNALAEEATQGKWGPATQLAGASFSVAHIGYTKARNERERTIKRLDAFLRGEDPNVVAPLTGEGAKKGEAKK